MTNVPKFINLLFQYPIIYDTKHPEYQNNMKKEQAWYEIALEMESDPITLRKRWKSLRDTYARYLKLQRSGNPSIPGAVPKEWHWAKNMSIFQPYLSYTRRFFAESNSPSSLNTDEYIELSIAEQFVDVVEEDHDEETLDSSNYNKTNAFYNTIDAESLSDLSSGDTNQSSSQNCSIFNITPEVIENFKPIIIDPGELATATTTATSSVPAACENPIVSAQEDECDIIGKNFAFKLRNLPPNLRIITERLMLDVILQAEAGNVDYNSTITIISNINNTPIEFIDNEYVSAGSQAKFLHNNTFDEDN